MHKGNTTFLNFYKLTLGVLVAVISAFSSCTARISQKDGFAGAFIPTQTNQLRRIAFFPLIAVGSGPRYNLLNNELVRNLQKACGETIVKNSEIGWGLSEKEVPNRQQMQVLAKALKADGVLTVYLEDNEELNVVLLNIVGNSVWNRRYKRRVNFRVSAREICGEIRHGERFVPLLPDYGNKVLVLPVMNKNEGTALASQWKTLIELKFQYKGYKILKLDSAPAPKFTSPEMPAKELFLPKDVSVLGSEGELDVNISSIAATFGADWIVVSHFDEYKYKNKNRVVASF